MKKVLIPVMSMVGLMITGCAIIPTEVPSTAYDNDAVKPGRPIPKAKYNVAVVVKDAQTRTKVGSKDHIKKCSETAKAETKASAIRRLNGLGWFQVANLDDAKEQDLLNSINGEGEASSDSGLLKADMFFVAETDWAAIGAEGKRFGREVNDWKHAGGIKLGTDMRLVNTANGKIYVRERFEGQSGIVTSGRDRTVPTFVPGLVDLNVAQFMDLLSARFLPGAEVLETRGSGKIARVGFGLNYQLTAGSKIDFFEDKEKEDGTFDRRVFATGEVLENGLEEKQCWVKVNSFETANVHVGHRAKKTEVIKK